MRQCFVPEDVAFIAGKVLEPYGDIANTPKTAIMSGIVLIPHEFAPEAEKFGWKRREGGPEHYCKLERLEDERLEVVARVDRRRI